MPDFAEFGLECRIDPRDPDDDAALEMLTRVVNDASGDFRVVEFVQDSTTWVVNVEVEGWVVEAELVPDDHADPVTLGSDLSGYVESENLHIAQCGGELLLVSEALDDG